jgi:hypothetical protein
VFLLKLSYLTAGVSDPNPHSMTARIQNADPEPGALKKNLNEGKNAAKTQINKPKKYKTINTGKLYKNVLM